MSQKIYIVEDEPDIRDTLKYNFSNEGFKVFTSPDGEEALSNIKKVLPDVLILDLMLPGQSGLDVCKSIRADDDIKETIDTFSQMLNFENYIVGNSSYSLWAALLSSNNESLVIVPDPWFRHDDHPVLKRKNWITVENN